MKLSHNQFLVIHSLICRGDIHTFPCADVACDPRVVAATAGEMEADLVVPSGGSPRSILCTVSVLLSFMCKKSFGSAGVLSKCLLP